MLGIHKVGGDRADYYLSDLAGELPVTMPGHWTGAASGPLGLEGPLVPEAFHLLLQGRHPRTGQPMGSGRTVVAAFDLTFSAPKSASVLFALGGVEVASRVAQIHVGAVHGALRYLEQHGVTATRRSKLESVGGPDHWCDRRTVHPRRQPQRRPPPAHTRRDGEPRPRRGRPLGRVRRAWDRGAPSGGIGGLRGAPEGGSHRGLRRALGGPSRSTVRDRGRRTRTAR